MRINFATLIIAILISTTAQAADNYRDVSKLEANSPNAGSVAPKDFDSLYRFPISGSESLELNGAVDFDGNYSYNSESPEAALRLNYSMDF